MIYFQLFVPYKISFYHHYSCHTQAEETVWQTMDNDDQRIITTANHKVSPLILLLIGPSFSSAMQIRNQSPVANGIKNNAYTKSGCQTETKNIEEGMITRSNTCYQVRWSGRLLILKLCDEHDLSTLPLRIQQTH